MPMNYDCFKGQVAVITGGGGELGTGCSVELTRWGASVALIDIHEGRLSACVDKLVKSGVPRSQIFDRVGDCTNQDTITSFVNDAVKTFGKINILINIVGCKRIKTLQTSTMDDWDWCINGTIKSMVMMCQACLPHLKQTKGNIINISSVSGMRPVWGALPYAVTNAAKDQFTRCTAQELAPLGIRVNCVAPGALKSEFNMRFGDIFTKQSQLETYFDVAGRSIPIGYMGDWTHVVPTIIFLASDKVEFTTGAVIPVDGGYVCTSACP